MVSVGSGRANKQGLPKDLCAGGRVEKGGSWGTRDMGFLFFRSAS